MATPQPVEIEEHEPIVEERRAKKLYWIIGAAVLALVIIYGIYAAMTSGKETTDDAQVAADVVPVASRVNGQVLTVSIVNDQPVRAGNLRVQRGCDLLGCKIDDRDRAILRVGRPQFPAIGRNVEADRLVPRDRAHLRNAAPHHARAEHADAFHDSGRSIRASQSPGAVNSDSVGIISSRVQRRFNCSSAPSLRSTTPRENASPAS